MVAPEGETLIILLFFPVSCHWPKASGKIVLYCFVHVHKKYKQGLAKDGKIGFCEILARKSCPTLRATVQVLLMVPPLPGLL